MTATTHSARPFGGPLDLGVAALSAVSVSFLAFAMPEALFSSLVSASHLPDVIAAAAPPLGMKARYAVMAGAGGLAFLLVWSLLRALDGQGAARPARANLQQDADPDAPRIRRADAHPDAPARRPIFAGSDFGEPDNNVLELETPESATAYRQPIQAPEPAPVAEPEPMPQPLPGGKLPRFMTEAAPEPAHEPEIDRNPVIPPSQKKSVEGLGVRAPAETDQPGGDSIGSLMHRLERGLVEREEPRPAPATMAAPDPELPAPLAAAALDPEASLPPEGVRHRLRSAISELNQRASRG